MARRRLVAILIGCILAAGIKVTNVYAEEKEGILEGSPLEVSADITLNSKYIWRGFALDDDPVMQEGIYVSAYGLTVSIWGSFDIDADDSLNSDEVDYSMDYTYEADRFSVSVGHTYYDFPPADTFSREFYIGVGLDSLLSSALTWYYDYGDEDSGGGNGDYIVLELSHSFSLGDTPLSLDLSGHIGYNNELFIKDEGGDAALGVGLTVPLTRNCTFLPNINYSVPLGDLEDSDDGNQDDEFYGGFTLAFSF